MVNMISLLLHIIAYHYDVSIGCTQVDSTPLNVLARGQVDNYSLDFFPWHEMAAWLESTIWTCHNVITITDFLLSLKHNHVYPMLWASNQTTHPHQRLLCCFFPGAWLKINGRVWLHKQPPLCCSAPEIGFGKGWGRSSMLAQLVFRYESILSCWSFLLTAFVRDYCTWDSCTRVEKQVALKDSCEYFFDSEGLQVTRNNLKKRGHSNLRWVQNITTLKGVDCWRTTSEPNKSWVNGMTDTNLSNWPDSKKRELGMASWNKVIYYHNLLFCLLLPLSRYTNWLDV